MNGYAFALLAVIALGVLSSSQTVFATETEIEANYDAILTDYNNNGSCDSVSGGITSPGSLYLGMFASSQTEDCAKSEIQFTIPKLGGSGGVTVTNVTGSIYLSFTNGTGETGNWVQLDHWDTTSRTDQQRWDSIGNGTDYTTGVAYTTISTWYNSTLGALAISDIQSLMDVSIFEIDNATSTGNSYDVTSQATAPYDITFKPDGTKAYVLDSAGDDLYQYTMTPAWNVTGMSYDSVSASVSEEQTARGVTFDSHGTRAYIVGSTNNTIFQYALTTPYDLSTMTYNNTSFDPVEATSMFDIEFNSNGNKMYILENFGTDEIQQYSLGDSWEIDTATYDSVSFDVSTVDTNPKGIDFNDDGTILLYTGFNNLRAYIIDLSTAYDLSTAAYNGVFKDISGSGTNPEGAHFRDDGGYFYVIEDSGNIVDEYSMPSLFTIGLDSSPEVQDSNLDIRIFDGVGSGNVPLLYIEYEDNPPSENPALPIPTGLTVLPIGTSPSTLNLTWNAPVPSTGVEGYKIIREEPVGNGFNTITSDTGNTTLTYTDTGLSVNTYYNYKVAALYDTYELSSYSNPYSQTTYHLPDIVDDLVANTTDFVSIFLTWSQPDILYGYLQGYMINYTSPTGDPQIIYTESPDTEEQIVGLPTGNYSFRVSAVTIHGTNVTGSPLANQTSVNNFPVGDTDIDFDEIPKSDGLPITFAETLNGTDIIVVVTYDSSYDLNCDVSYLYAMTNTTYTGLTETPIGGSAVTSDFTFISPYNDQITIACEDDTDPTINGQHIIIRDDFDDIPFFGQMLNFTGGEYGTDGTFGAFDLITIIVIILSMIGFNRYNPAVGLVIMVVILGTASFYGVISLSTTIFGILAVAVLLAITTVKKI